MVIRSGGQRGADIGALLAAKAAGVATAGWIPRGCLTESGRMPELVEYFGLTEHPSEEYAPRTFANVRDSDGTLRFASDFTTPGEVCTLKAIKQYRQLPPFDVDVNAPSPHETVADWIIENKIGTLNVAGNRESTSPGIEVFVEQYLTIVIRLLRKRGYID